MADVAPAATVPDEGAATSQLVPSSVMSAEEKVTLLPLTLLMVTIWVSDVPVVPVMITPFGETCTGGLEPAASTVSVTVIDCGLLEVPVVGPTDNQEPPLNV